MNLRNRRQNIIGLLAALAIAPGWLVQAGEPPRPGPEQEIYRRSSIQFQVAGFFKPAEADTENPAFKLAPLFLWEVEESGSAPGGSNCLGTVTIAASGGVKVDHSKNVVYVHSDTVRLRGKLHARLTYLWFCGTDASGDPGSAAQGIRITLNSSGDPAVWEVLKDKTGLDLIFVSQNVESAAGAEFGPPPAGRKYAAEASAALAAKTIVARVIDDGPMPMGPIVYLSKQSGDVATVICRCMPAQAKKLSGTVTYELQKWPRHPLPMPAGAAFWPDWPDDHLETGLRLPEKF